MTEGNKRRFQLRIDPVLFDDVQKMAKERRVTITSIVEEQLRQAVAHYKLSQMEDAEQI